MKIHLLTGTGTIAKLLCRSKPAGVGAEAVTGGALRLAMQMKVPEAMREDVIERVKFIQRKHNTQEEH